MRADISKAFGLAGGWERREPIKLKAGVVGRRGSTTVFVRSPPDVSKGQSNLFPVLSTLYTRACLRSAERIN